jgi:alpha-tubulin suppressor-like RCC1 family protein
MLMRPVGGWCVQPAVAGGDNHTIALKNNGTVWAWGHNGHGQLGDGTTSDRSIPVQVRSSGGGGVLTNAKGIAGSEDYSAALKADGTVWSWGCNDFGKLGDNTLTDRETPVQVKGPGGAGFLGNVRAVTAGNYHMAALKNDGTVWSWGCNACGQLGDGTTTDRKTPVQVKGSGGAGFLGGVTAVTAGYSHTVALKGDGTVWAWGYNDHGQLGDGTTTDRWTPVQVKGPGGAGFLEDVAAIAAGFDHVMALKEDGTVWAWGCNDDGQLGDGTTTWRSTPVQVKGPGGVGFLGDVTAVAAGYGHTAAPKADGTVWAWGRNGTGQLGDGTTTWRSTPVQVLGPGGAETLNNVIAVAAGRYHTVALKNDGAVWAWGDNIRGQLGDGTTTDRWTPVRVLSPEGEGFLSLGFYATYDYYIPYAISNSNYWTGVGLKDANPWFTTSVNATVYETTGAILATESRSLDPRGQAAFMVGSGLDREGWARITSNEPLTGLGFVAMVHDDKLMFDIPFVSEPATTLYVPHVAQDATWDTIVYVCNPHDSATTMYLSFFDSAGTVVKVSKGYTLPANGSGSYPLSALLGEDSYTSGSVRITASQGVAAFALYHNLKTGARSYAGISAVAPEPHVLMPAPYSYDYYLPYALSDADYWTGVGLRNGSTAGIASVTVTGVGQDGSDFDTQTRTIPSSGQTAFMMGRGEGWVRITSDKPLTGLGFVAMAHDDRLMFDIPFVSKLATTLHVPHVAQDDTWDTIVYVCNPHGSATTLYLTLVRSNGTVVVSQPYTLSADASGAYLLSALVGGGDYTSGSVEITASQGVAAFALYHNLKTGDRSYAGISAVKP